MGLLQRARLYYWTLRYLSFNQIYTRVKRVIRRRWWRWVGRSSLASEVPDLRAIQPLWLGLSEISSAHLHSSEIDTLVKQAKHCANGSFEFLERRVQFQGNLGWHDPALSQLWRYHLHYFDYIEALLVWQATGDKQNAWSAFREIAQDWIHNNKSISGDGWHPYTISLRVVNWLQAMQAFSSQLAAEPEFRDLLMRSLLAQAQVLQKDQELDVRGNHLIENLRALIWLGIALQTSDAKSWQNDALALLEKEIAEQVLVDGGHFERSPAYHLVVLEDCIEVGLLLRRNIGSAPNWLDAAILRMLLYLTNILPSNGYPPLLKDTAWDAAASPTDLLAAGALYLNAPEFKQSEHFGLLSFLLFGQAGWETFKSWPVNRAGAPSAALTASGYFVLRNDEVGDHLIFDVGLPCPSYLPAHAHADLLSYELTVAGQRIVVDSGVYEYTSGLWRQFFRSTRAHNTVEVAGQDQSEVWASFRVARRARPAKLVFNRSPNSSVLQAEHDGYKRLSSSITHRRTVFHEHDKFWLIVDELTGHGSVGVRSFVHLHPDVKVHQGPAANLWQFDAIKCPLPLWLTTFGASRETLVCGQMEPECQGWYSERFGSRQCNPVVTLIATGTMPVSFGYVISKDQSATVEITQFEHGITQVRVHHDGFFYTYSTQLTSLN